MGFVASGNVVNFDYSNERPVVTYATLPANRVKAAAQSAEAAFDPAKHELIELYASQKRSLFKHLITLCLAADAASGGRGATIQISLNDFSWIADHYELGS